MQEIKKNKRRKVSYPVTRRFSPGGLSTGGLSPGGLYPIFSLLHTIASATWTLHELTKIAPESESGVRSVRFGDLIGVLSEINWYHDKTEAVAALKGRLGRHSPISATHPLCPHFIGKGRTSENGKGKKRDGKGIVGNRRLPSPYKCLLLAPFGLPKYSQKKLAPQLQIDRRTVYIRCAELAMRYCSCLLKTAGRLSSNAWASSFFNISRTVIVFAHFCNCLRFISYEHRIGTPAAIVCKLFPKTCGKILRKTGGGAYRP